MRQDGHRPGRTEDEPDGAFLRARSTGSRSGPVSWKALLSASSVLWSGIQAQLWTPPSRDGAESLAGPGRRRSEAQLEPGGLKSQVCSSGAWACARFSRFPVHLPEATPPKRRDSFPLPAPALRGEVGFSSPGTQQGRLHIPSPRPPAPHSPCKLPGGGGGAPCPVPT